MAHTFKIEPEALKRCFSVYVVVAKRGAKAKLYIGKTGDNRKGCNPIISRCGNHFSYNKIHSQIRNKVKAHEDWQYIYAFEHFDPYPQCEDARTECIAKINEMERWLNEMIQELAKKCPPDQVQVLNPYHGRGYITPDEIDRRKGFRTEEAAKKLKSVVTEVASILSGGR